MVLWLSLIMAAAHLSCWSQSCGGFLWALGDMETLLTVCCCRRYIWMFLQAWGWCSLVLMFCVEQISITSLSVNPPGTTTGALQPSSVEPETTTVEKDDPSFSPTYMYLLSYYRIRTGAALSSGSSSSISGSSSGEGTEQIQRVLHRVTWTKCTLHFKLCFVKKSRLLWTAVCE